MKVLITAVGKRSEHWTDLFAALCARGDIQLTLALADVSERTLQVVRGYQDRWPRLRCHVVPHLLAENRSGHMASVMFRPGASRVLASYRPDVVHIIGEAAYLSTWQVIRHRDRRWPNVPVTLYAAQNIVMRFPPPFPRLERRAYQCVQHMLPITPAALETIRAKGYRGPATIVPLGVDTALFRPAPTPTQPRRFTIGFVGRLEPHKGVADLLRAAERLDCDLLVVGDGSLAPAVRQAADRRPGRVVLHDWVDHAELPGLLARMDALVLPSIEVIQRNVVPWIGVALREQFGRALIEAMACAIPVVGSDVGEIPYVIGTSGLTFPAGDVSALCSRLADLRDDPAFARRLGEDGARRVATDFSWHRIAGSLSEIWASTHIARRDQLLLHGNQALLRGDQSRPHSLPRPPTEPPNAGKVTTL